MAMFRYRLHETLRALVDLASQAPALLTARLADPRATAGFFVMARGRIQGVVEDKDASEEQRRIEEINTGVLAAPAEDLQAYLPQVGNENQQGEYYLPDILGLAVADGIAVAGVEAGSEMDILGVNDRVQLNPG